MANNNEDHLAYGDYHPQSERTQADEEYEGEERGIIGDTFGRFRKRYQSQISNPSDPSLSGSSQNQPPGSLGGSLFEKIHGVVHGLGSEIHQRLVEGQHSPTPTPGTQNDAQSTLQHRFGSFAPQRSGNDVKWHVDGCQYMWAVSKAIEQSTESIWILDWWLSPELYLRRPPSKNQQYRLDRMLQAAALRGVKVNIIVYKEVTQALTRKYLSPILPKYLHSLLHPNTDAITSWMSRMGLAATFASLEYMEAENPLIAPILPVSSSHTKHTLENLHPNISVFRHPDHLPDAQTVQSSFFSSLQNLALTAKTASQLPGDALKAIYGFNEDVILYWAHHEKLCIVDGCTAFMGGLDLCYGRWDTNQHPIADCHPSDLDKIVFPGQDFNNARIMDFQDVAHWENNKLLRKDSSRMGWSDVSFSLQGPVVEDLKLHFVERWNFIFEEKYNVRKDVRYSKIAFRPPPVGANPENERSPPATHGNHNDQYYGQPSQVNSQAHGDQDQNYRPSPFPGPPIQGSDHSVPASQHYSTSGDHHFHQQFQGLSLRNEADSIRDRFESGVQYMENRYNEHEIKHHVTPQSGGMSCQLVRSCSKWSHGVRTEQSIADAYINVIRNSRHFIYIENQFFITATSDAQRPVKNKIGAAIVERILEAARTREKYRVIVVMPAIPAFAGDLMDDSSLGTRAIMEFQYNAINRGGHSIMELIANAGVDPLKYIRFYNLRNYDRINSGASMRYAEKRSGVDYEDARKEHDEITELPTETTEHGESRQRGLSESQTYQRYQQAATSIPNSQGLGNGRWDSVSECYMLSGTDIRQVPWENGDIPEIDAIVSEELYVHSKVLIADDRVVICGSANLNDRSQLGDHDSEIAIIVEDSVQVDSKMNGRLWQASKFATTLRRQLMRKHLGLIPPENMERPNANSEPVGIPNDYDFGSPEDQLVMDPLSEQFLGFWNSRARQNTFAFGRIFHPVPHDDVRTWDDYNKFYGRFFKAADKAAEGKEAPRKSAKYQWGHVVTENFSSGTQGTREVKELLGTIKGTLVEMPLLFLIKEDIAKEGISLNAFTETVYT